MSFWECDLEGGDGYGDLEGDLLVNDLKGMSEGFRKYPDRMGRLSLFLTWEEGGRR
jgi:hypothetical protein